MQSIRRLTLVLDRPSTGDNNMALRGLRSLFGLKELCVDVSEMSLRGYDGFAYETDVVMIATSIRPLRRVRLTAVKGTHPQNVLQEAEGKLEKRIVGMREEMRAMAARR